MTNNELKIFCMKEHLGCVQDKTKLTKEERQFLLDFTKSVEWFEKQITPLYNPNIKEIIEKRLNNSYSNKIWKSCLVKFIDKYYIDIYSGK